MTDVKAPSKLLMLTEGRSIFEIGAGLLSLPLIKNLAPIGDGQPVLVLPGLGAGDFSTKILRKFLNDLGYTAYGWELGVNCGMQGNMLEKVVDKISYIHSKHNRSISIVGQSLGGIFARESAKLATKKVRQVITLGSPFTGSIDATNAHFAYRLLSGQTVTDKDRDFYATVRNKPAVPTTSVFSKLDGIVSWHCSIEESTVLAENIELVGSTHIGMASSPQALYLISHRLAEKEGTLSKFQPAKIMKPFYK